MALELYVEEDRLSNQYRNQLHLEEYLLIPAQLEQIVIKYSLL